MTTETPACECGAAVGHVCHAAECVPVCAYHSPTCPVRKAEPQGSDLLSKLNAQAQITGPMKYLAGEQGIEPPIPLVESMEIGVGRAIPTREPLATPTDCAMCAALVFQENRES